MLLEHFKITGIAVFQIFLLAAIGYFLVKKKFLESAGLDCLSNLVMNVTLPVLIFCELIRNFSFQAYQNWWVFPLLSLLITLSGLAVGFLFSFLVKGEQHRLQFMSLVGFQNSGYLPLALLTALLPQAVLNTMFIYLFLFLAGFNLVIFSLGVHILNFRKEAKFNWTNLLSVPVIATLFSLIIIFLGLNRFVPEAVIEPLQLLGNTTLALAMLVVGGNLAEINLKHIDKKAMLFLILAKMIILPAIGLVLFHLLSIPKLIGLLIIMQLAVPSATTLSVILRSYKKEDLLISQGTLLTHLASVFTIPVFLLLYFSQYMLK